MNINQLKKFAQEARRKLLEQVGAKLNFVLTTDSAELREKTEQLKQLRLELGRTTKEQLIERVAYTWFNRLMALRFMDANDYQPLGIRIITPKDGYTIPELLDEAKRGNIPEELKLNRQRIYDILDNRIPSKNPQNEAYKELLIAACNHLHTTFSFLFEKINDYTELLLPDDLTSDFSIVTDVREGMLSEDCQNVEIIGWLYQFYISEENERLIQSKEAYKKNELAPASQLFTPKWIVQYMVDNTLGQILSEFFPSTTLIQNLSFYIKPVYNDKLQPRNKKKLEELKFFDPCVGSAHILSYAFDVFYLIYKEQGYNESEIPELIIKNNLYGTDIDERAAQLSSFVLMIKGRQYYRRFFKNDIRPNIAFFQDIESDDKFRNASSIGSLIKVKVDEIEEIIVETDSLFSERQNQLKSLYRFLGQQYDIVVTNPPYISSSRMEGTLKQYVDANFSDTKSDLFATFILRCLELCTEDGLTGYMSPFVWMFIASYEKLRRKIIDEHFINNLIQLEYSGFEGATVPICTFTLRKSKMLNEKGSYIRLNDFKGAKLQEPKTLEAIKNPNCGWFFVTNQADFEKIPNSPIAYWLTNKEVKIFCAYPALGEQAKPIQCSTLGNNDKFIRYHFEVPIETRNAVWFPTLKGGDYRKWFGNIIHVVDWEQDGYRIKKDGRQTIRNAKYLFKSGINWGRITSYKSSYRIHPEGMFFESASGVIIEADETKKLFILGYLNTKLPSKFLSALNPTLTFQSGDIARIPFYMNETEEIIPLVKSCVEITMMDWNANEISLDFRCNELLRLKSDCSIDLEEAYDLFVQYWSSKFIQLHKNEEELNRLFAKIYGLNDELSPDVPLDDITILQDEVDRQLLTKFNKKIIRDPKTFSILNYHQIAIPYVSKVILGQFISYCVGCMMGRYSLESEGLILANQGETFQDFIHRIDISEHDCAFLPDKDNIIPILEDEWFEDDIVGKFYHFLKVTFGEKNFNKNIAFIEEQIEKDIRKYFIKDFYTDHIKQYKKRPIYWMFSSPKGSFNILIYMHRYTPDTVSNILNKYLKEFIGKLNTRKEHLEHVQVTGPASDKTKAIKEIDNIEKMLIELHEYERDILYPLATERIEIDLDDGVLVNYNKFGKAVKEVSGLNDPATKKKVKQFDWIDTSQIR